MNEENMLDEEDTKTFPSESAFSGTSDEDRYLPESMEAQIPKSNTVPMAEISGHLLRATRYGHTLALLVPKRLIPEHRRRDIFEVEVIEADNPSKSGLLYTTHPPGYKHAYLDLYQLNPDQAERYRVKTVRLYTESELALDYNGRRPRGLENTMLVCADGKLTLMVDDEPVDLGNQRFRTYQGQAVLDFVLGIAGPMKITKNVQGLKVRLRDHSPVTSVKKHGNGLLLTYSRTDHDPYPHTRSVISPSNRVVVNTGVPDWRDGLRLTVTEKPSSLHDWYLIEVSLDTLRQLSRALGSAKDLDEYRETKGEMAEEMVKLTLPALGMKLVVDHPKTPRWWTSKSKRPGPDLLTRTSVEEDLCYVECKWWGQVGNAIRNATRQVQDDLRKGPYHEGERVAWGYIAVLEWEMQTPMFRLHFKRVG